MKCTHPLYAIDHGFNKATGKRSIKILPRRVDIYTLQELENRYGSGCILSLPCGHCDSCKENKAQEWSVRCMLEASEYKSNYFLTLTYDDKMLPTTMDDNVSNVKDFIKRLRYYVPGLRYFGCTERGSTTGRLHAHLILFNCDLPDIKLECAGRISGSYMSSEIISQCWSKDGESYGHIVLGDCTQQSCAYVARYTMKARFGDEKIFMSTHPGIGAKYCYDKLYTIFDTDGVYVNGRKYVIPRYFDKICEKVHPLLFCESKERRLLFQRDQRNNTLSSFNGFIDEQINVVMERYVKANNSHKLIGGVL